MDSLETRRVQIRRRRWQFLQDPDVMLASLSVCQRHYGNHPHGDPTQTATLQDLSVRLSGCAQVALTISCHVFRSVTSLKTSRPADNMMILMLH